MDLKILLRLTNKLYAINFHKIAFFGETQNVSGRQPVRHMCHTVCIKLNFKGLIVALNFYNNAVYFISHYQEDLVD
jgi:hypothetical protein